MPALELLTGFVTAPSTTYTAWTLAAGNVLTVRNTPADSDIRLLTAWADNQAAGNLRIRSPQLHDNVNGINTGIVIGEVSPQIPLGSAQRLIPQDTLTVEQTGSATAGDIETGCILIHYPNLPGIDARLIKSEDVRSRSVDIMTVLNTLATGTAGGYSGEEAINAEQDLWKGNTDYALLGYLVSAECACVRWRGADTGNLGVGGPGNIENRRLTSRWFMELSDAFDIPLIPVFNSANKGNILVDAAQDENGADVTVTSIFAQLSQ